MDPSELFSHPQQPEFVSSRDTSTEPAELPTFSDRPESQAAVAPASSP
jgi:hypothetical protein